jgi:hypothetical protein
MYFSDITCKKHWEFYVELRRFDKKFLITFVDFFRTFLIYINYEISITNYIRLSRFFGKNKFHLP